MNAKETALKLLPNLPIPTEMLAQLLKAAETEDLAAVIVAAYKLGYQQGQQDR